MKIAIISDTHDNIPNLEKALAWMKQNNIAQIIHCGDLCAPVTLKETLGPGFAGPIHMVYGNVEDRINLPKFVDMFDHITHYGDVGDIVIDGKRVAFNHYPDKAKELARTGKYAMSFHGHTHKPWLDSVPASPRLRRASKTTSSKGGKKECRVVNPGTLAGLFAKATFAVWDTKTDELELKILELI